MVMQLRKISDASLRVFGMLTILCLMVGCSSHPVATVDERSNQHLYKGKVHSVKAGDTLFSIAWRYGVDYKKLAEFNGIRPPYTIYPAQKIRVDLRAAKGQNKNLGNSSVAVKKSPAKAAVSEENRSIKRSDISPKSTSTSAVQGTPKWQWPASGKLVALFQGESGLHKGIDLSGKLGEPVLAAASGRVVYAGSGLSGYGKLLIIKHNDTFLSAYAHNDEISVKEGDSVKAGQRIADMGSSGTDRVKLHFEIRSEGSPVDPLKFLPKR
jgi:lipoprotein NlpD